VGRHPLISAALEGLSRRINEAFCEHLLSVFAPLLPSEKVLMPPGTHQNAAFIDFGRNPVHK
jgi:hypothetical protein